LSQLDRRHALKLIATLGAAGSLAPALSACASGAAQPSHALGETLRVGLITPLTGANSAFGTEISNGFQLYLNTHRNQFGNHPVRVVKVDEGDSLETAKAAVDQLVSKEQVQILAGISNAAALGAVKDAVEKAKVPLVTPSPSLAAMVSTPYIWRTSFVTDEPGKALGQWVANHANGPVFILAEDGPGARDDARGFINALKTAGGTIAAEPTYAAFKSKDFNNQPTALKGSATGALYCQYAAANAVDLVKQLRDSGLPKALQIYGPGLLTEGTQLTQQGDAAAGIYTAMNYSYDLDTPDNRQFVSGYQKAYGTTPTEYAVAAYDVAAVLDQAIAQVGDDASALAVNTAISKLGQIPSPRGQWQFNQTRSPLQKWYLRQVKADGPVLANVLTAELVTLG
jgi:branched-chain amino acid transport system substrate-binding protein